MTNFDITERPVKGDINTGYTHIVEQVGAEEFLRAIDRVLAVPGVEGVVWNQYTPYFNDGDACEFSIHEASVILSFGDEYHEDEYGREGTYDLDSLGPLGKNLTYKDRPNDAQWGSKVYQEWRDAYYSDDNRTFEVNGHDTQEIYRALEEFNAGLSSFESVARTNFGDHAEVTATLGGFNVEGYDHD